MSERFDIGCLNPMASLENSLSGMGNIRPELHVAQQSRRDKLRVHQFSTPSDHIEDIPNYLGQLPVDSGLNPELIQVRNVRNCSLLYDTMFSSEMLHFARNSHVLSAPKGTSKPGGSVGAEEASHANSYRPNSLNFNPFAKVSDPHNATYSKGVESHQNYDWGVNYADGSESSSCNQSPPFVKEVISGTMKVNNICASSHYSKPGYHGYQDVQSSLINPCSEISSQESQKQYREAYYNSRYGNTFQEVATSSIISSQGFQAATLVKNNNKETDQGSWVDGGSELTLLPTCWNQVNALRLDNTAGWMHRPDGANQQWSGEIGFAATKIDGDLGTVAIDSRAQGLFLSLSSHLPSEINVAQLGDRFGSENLQSRSVFSGGPQDLTTDTSISLYSNSKPYNGNMGYENSIRSILGSSTNAHRSTGPLGPFTGYATILKNSKFLKPAQQLLDAYCSVTGSKLTKISEKGSEDLSISGDTGNVENGIGGNEVNSGVSSSMVCNPSTFCNETRVGNRSSESCQPDYQQKKAKLLNMREEVCKMYKQYHQQMQIVVSSFESVAGLSSATPYTCFALKAVSRHFRCLKNAISEQLRRLSKVLGEDLSFPKTGASSSQGDATIPRLKVIDQSLLKHKTGGDSLGFLDPQQHVWRPQRGLPERAVSILRTWLFEHFLHPYPTDTDKHMLATQTGLTRNQVSNWFINARVRLWKPMVEEIHTLEMKGSSEPDLNSGKNAEKHTGDTERDGVQSSNKLTTDGMSDKQQQMAYSARAKSTMNTRDKQWEDGKRSRMDDKIAGDLEGSLIGFVPYNRRSGVEIGGLGTVSLTLGLRHSSTTESAAQLEQEEHLLRRQFGGQMIPDFVG